MHQAMGHSLVMNDHRCAMVIDLSRPSKVPRDMLPVAHGLHACMCACAHLLCSSGYSCDNARCV